MMRMLSMLLITAATCAVLVLLDDHPERRSDEETASSHNAGPGGRREQTDEGKDAFTNCADKNRGDNDDPASCRPNEGGGQDGDDCITCQVISQYPAIDDQVVINPGYVRYAEISCFGQDGKLYRGECVDNTCTMEEVIGDCANNLKDYLRQTTDRDPGDPGGLGAG